MSFKVTSYGFKKLFNRTLNTFKDLIFTPVRDPPTGGWVENRISSLVSSLPDNVNNTRN